jgi:AraC-like DNA-binding protein
MTDDLPALVSGRLRETGEGYPSLARMAAGLCMSPRTLKRRLRAHGVRFRQLLDGVRFRESAQLLEQSDLTVEQIALRLGYSSPANFSRAFRRWSGHAPGAYRRAEALRDWTPASTPAFASRQAEAG